MTEWSRNRGGKEGVTAIPFREQLLQGGRKGGRSEPKMLNCKRRDAGLVKSPVSGMRRYKEEEMIWGVRCLQARSKEKG